MASRFFNITNIMITIAAASNDLPATTQIATSVIVRQASVFQMASLSPGSCVTVAGTISKAYGGQIQLSNFIELLLWRANLTGLS